MKKKFLVLGLGVLVASCNIFAAKISVETAQNVALNFFNVNTAVNQYKTAPLTASLKYTRTEADNTVDFYVFDIAPHGFVIVSADDNILPVLAYSTESYFIPNLNKTGLVNWMNHAAVQIYAGIQQQVKADARISGLWSDYMQGNKPSEVKSNVVAPLIATTWNQEPYYNALCPFNSTNNDHAVTGCVATTMAQIMKYWSYPPQGTGTNSYNDATPLFSNNYGVQTANFGATTYDWAAMPLSISSVNTQIATLMYQCGVSVDMDYGDDSQGGSGAEVLIADAWFGGPSAQSAFANNFGYNASAMRGEYQTNYSSTDWYNLMKADLDAGRPIQYEGTDPSAGGHTWVCDGYDGTGLLHMNWGWGGASDGYFNVSSLVAGGYNFSSQEGALLGIEPLVPALVSSTHVSICSGDSAVVKVHGAATASYTWAPTTALDCSNCAQTIAHPNSTTSYTVTIDSAGVSSTSTVIVTVYPKLHIAAHLVTAASCYGLADGQVSVRPSGGTPAYTYLWSNGQTADMVPGVMAGTYVVTVSDAVGCQATVSEVVTQPSGIVTTVTTTPVSGCTTADGSASITATGGAGTLSYRWSSGGDTTTTVTDVIAGTYPVTVTDSHGCTTVTDVVIPEPYQIQFTTTTTNAAAGEDNGTASVENVTAGTAPYSFAWNNGDATETIANLAPGTYIVTVTDNNGCRESDSVTVGVTAASAINAVSDALLFSVYPNPMGNRATVLVNQLGTGTALRLENVLGQTLITKPLSAIQTQIDLSTFPDGVYFIELQQGEKKAVKEIVLSR